MPALLKPACTWVDYDGHPTNCIQCTFIFSWINDFYEAKIKENVIVCWAEGSGTYRYVRLNAEKLMLIFLHLFVLLLYFKNSNMHLSFRRVGTLWKRRSHFRLLRKLRLSAKFCNFVRGEKKSSPLFRNDWTGVWRCESRQSSSLILSAGNMGGVNFEKNLKESD